VLCHNERSRFLFRFRVRYPSKKRRGYGKPTQPISPTLAKVDPSSISDEELAAIAINGASVNAQAH